MEYNSATKRNSLLIHTMMVMNHNHYDNWKKKTRKKEYPIWFYFFKILQNPNESIVTEGRSVVALQLTGSGGRR